MNLSEWPVQHYCGTIKLLLIPSIGPDLPFGIPDADLIEDPAGGVILVGGNSPLGLRSTLFRLAHADATEWHEMPQKLAVARQFHKAFLIPDGLSRCGNQ